MITAVASSVGGSSATSVAGAGLVGAGVGVGTAVAVSVGTAVGVAEGRAVRVGRGVRVGVGEEDSEESVDDSSLSGSAVPLASVVGALGSGVPVVAVGAAEDGGADTPPGDAGGAPPSLSCTR